MNDRYRPFLFFSIALLVPWLLWFAAAGISRSPQQEAYQGLQGMLGLIGLLAPALTAAVLFFRAPVLAADLRTRLFRLGGFPRRYLWLAVFLLPVSLIVAQLISICFGHSWAQFTVSGHPSFRSALFSPWFMLMFAPVAEELAWHSYGTDSLNKRFSLFTTSMIFAVYWAFWHFPLFFIKGYYQSEVAVQGWLYTLNFVVSLLIFVLLMNWLYVKSGRSVMVAILFHLCGNVGNEVFATHPDSKVIQTVLLTVLVLWVLYKEKAVFFLQRKENEA
ncbi:MAG: CPBP family intramembrane metalloprotease [Neisseria sp.]|uniref:CPBP family intramembrane glutamic endopeptidase n=1 Tax=Neisseria sp. TaxID=192066 RepID=UPI0026DB8A3A|nr:CPBP family intramembrane glutamic endopeptidase [Neisseria sp.]MDO4641891.1 CPBP family intramembrane metalloprotease [Neisseria sp.]